MGHVPPPPPPFLRSARYRMPEPPPKPIDSTRFLATPIEKLVALMIVVVLTLPIVAAYNEARVFNRCTGASITTWDALWADFRIVECDPVRRRER